MFAFWSWSPAFWEVAEHPSLVGSREYTCLSFCLSILYSLPHPTEKGSDRVARLGTWHSTSKPSLVTLNFIAFSWGIPNNNSRGLPCVVYIKHWFIEQNKMKQKKKNLFHNQVNLKKKSPNVPINSNKWWKRNHLWAFPILKDKYICREKCNKTFHKLRPFQWGFVFYSITSLLYNNQLLTPHELLSFSLHKLSLTLPLCCPSVSPVPLGARGYWFDSICEPSCSFFQDL